MPSRSIVTAPLTIAILLCYVTLASHLALGANRSAASSSNFSLPAKISNGLRKALVIGNANYPRGGLFNHLTNPHNDATDLTSSLRGYGFQVTQILDANPQTLAKAITTFTDKLARDDVALVYYSGHGVATVCDSHPDERRNYLIPVGRVLRNRADVCEYAISAQWLLGQLNLRGGGTNLLLLDACREVLALNEAKGFENKGFAEMHGAGSFISYAAEPGQSALGDRESRHSLYTGQLLTALAPPHDDLPVQFLFMQVREAVAEAANTLHARQIPWSDDGLVGSFCFRPCRPLNGPVITQAELDQARQEQARLEQDNRHKDEELKRLREQIAQQSQMEAELATQDTKTDSAVDVDTSEVISRHYLDHGDGTVTDTETNLMWKRCSEGQTWTGSTCLGKGRNITWDDAMLGEQQKLWPAFAGYNDWHMPTRKELNSLVYCGSSKLKAKHDAGNWCEGDYKTPTIDAVVFPNILAYGFWSATPVATDAAFAWSLSFDDGLDYWDDRSTTLQVRLVRRDSSGPLYRILHAAGGGEFTPSD